VTFKDWATSKGLVEQETSRQEIAELFKLADETLNDCRILATTVVSAHSKYVIAYNAALACAEIPLRALGYRTKEDSKGGHNLIFQALDFSVDPKGQYIAKLQAARSIRRQVTYDSVGSVGLPDVVNLIDVVSSLRNAVEKWIRKEHPKLLPPEPEKVKF